MESREVVSRGYFWTEDPELAIAGELKYTPEDGISLYLFGSFHDIYSLESKTPDRYPVIHGRGERLGYVNLLNAFVVSQKFGSRPTASEVHADLMICASSGNDYISAPVLKLSAEVDYLPEWLGISGFSFKHASDSRSVEIGYTSPSARKYAVDDDTVAFVFERTGPTISVIQKEAAVSQTTKLSIAFGVPTALDRATEKLTVIKDLIALGVGRSLSLSNLEAKFAVVSTEVNGLWAEVFERPVESTARGNVTPWGMLFTFKDVENNFEEVLSSWLAIVEETKPLYRLYSATTRARRIYAEHRLLNFFQGLESYHRVKKDVSQMQKQRVKSLKAKMLAACSEEEQNWLQERLQHLHEPTAAERIRELIVQFEAEWIFMPEWEATVKRIKNLRNYFTHYSRVVAPESLETASIYNDGSRLQVLCEQILLVGIGFSTNEAKTLLQANQRLQRLTLS